MIYTDSPAPPASSAHISYPLLKHRDQRVRPRQAKEERGMEEDGTRDESRTESGRSMRAGWGTQSTSRRATASAAVAHAWRHILGGMYPDGGRCRSRVHGRAGGGTMRSRRGRKGGSLAGRAYVCEGDGGLDVRLHHFTAPGRAWAPPVLAHWCALGTHRGTVTRPFCPPAHDPRPDPPVPLPFLSTAAFQPSFPANSALFPPSPLSSSGTRAPYDDDARRP